MSDDNCCKKPRMELNEGLVKVDVKWNSKVYNLFLDPDDDVMILKHKIQIETEILPVSRVKKNLGWILWVGSFDLVWGIF